MAAELRAEVEKANWSEVYAEGKTKFLVETSWFASEERCEVLRRLCKKYNATRVLEVGACCGVASLSMAEVLPDDGEVVALELDPYLAQFGQNIMDKSNCGHKIKYMVGPAMDSLRDIARQCFDGKMKPFDLLLIDADRAGMMDYFKLFWWESPGVLSTQATVCIDITPYKGQAPQVVRGPSSGKLAAMGVGTVEEEADAGQSEVLWVPSGQEQIDELRRTLEASSEHTVYKVANLLVSHSKDGKRDTDAESQLSTPRRKAGGGPWSEHKFGSPTFSPGLSPSLSHAANPFASFPNDRMKGVGAARWVPPVPSNPVMELRNKVMNEDWAALFAAGKTLTRVEANWSGSKERCEVMKCIMSASKITRILEIGSFCGITSLSMAENLPSDGQVVSLELDAFLAKFGDDIRAKCTAGSKIRHLIGLAATSLDLLADEAKVPDFKPFDLVIIDADRSGMQSYFHKVTTTQGMLAEGGTVCIDITPYKGQMPVRHSTLADQWIVPSGMDKVDELVAELQSDDKFTLNKQEGLLLVKVSTMPEIAL